MENELLLFFPGGDKSLNSYDTSAQGTQILELGVRGGGSRTLLRTWWKLEFLPGRKMCKYKTTLQIQGFVNSPIQEPSEKGCFL